MVVPEGIFPAKGNWHREQYLGPDPRNHKLVQTEDRLPVSSWSPAGPASSPDHCPPDHTPGLVCKDLELFSLGVLPSVSLGEV